MPPHHKGNATRGARICICGYLQIEDTDRIQIWFCTIIQIQMRIVHSFSTKTEIIRNVKERVIRAKHIKVKHTQTMYEQQTSFIKFEL